jgi:hypothetical protein
MVQESVLRPDTARTERLGVRGSYLFDRELNNAECASREISRTQVRL